jgi:hypothetical protein
VIFFGDVLATFFGDGFFLEDGACCCGSSMTTSSSSIDRFATISPIFGFFAGELTVSFVGVGSFFGVTLSFFGVVDLPFCSVVDLPFCSVSDSNSGSSSNSFDAGVNRFFNRFAGDDWAVDVVSEVASDNLRFFSVLEGALTVLAAVPVAVLSGVVGSVVRIPFSFVGVAFRGDFFFESVVVVVVVVVSVVSVSFVAFDLLLSSRSRTSFVDDERGLFFGDFFDAEFDCSFVAFDDVDFDFDFTVSDLGTAFDEFCADGLGEVCDAFFELVPFPKKRRIS